ncbi:MAG: ABC transporter ATP-binding protein [Clostridia bacterium]|nr:ABC transporter ATP-binding protein [Clostridia bacterium]
MQKEIKMIKITNLCKNFQTLQAVDNLSLEILEGETFALLGLNGAGKSTTINILCGLLQKTSGQIEVQKFNLDKDMSEIKKIINLSPQETAIANNLTVTENLELIANLYKVENVKDKTKQMLETFDLESKQSTLAKKLSGGQKRKLSIAMALITNPKILILDEPTLGLDIKSRKALWKIISSLKGKTTIILTTHYLEEAENLSDRIGIMTNGKLVALGTKEEIVLKSQKQNFEEAFLFFAGGEDDE